MLEREQVSEGKSFAAVLSFLAVAVSCDVLLSRRWVGVGLNVLGKF
jgi:hypothetical protein